MALGRVGIVVQSIDDLPLIGRVEIQREVQLLWLIFGLGVLLVGEADHGEDLITLVGASCADMDLVRAGLVDDAHDGFDFGARTRLNLHENVLELALKVSVDEVVLLTVHRERLEYSCQLKADHVPALVHLHAVSPDHFLHV